MYFLYIPVLIDMPFILFMAFWVLLPIWHGSLPPNVDYISHGASGSSDTVVGVFSHCIWSAHSSKWRRLYIGVIYTFFPYLTTESSMECLFALISKRQSDSPKLHLIETHWRFCTQHIAETGVESGQAMLLCPAQSVYVWRIEQSKRNYCYYERGAVYVRLPFFKKKKKN